MCLLERSVVFGSFCLLLSATALVLPDQLNYPHLYGYASMLPLLVSLCLSPYLYLRTLKAISSPPQRNA